MSSFASFLNASGIALIRKKKFSEGLAKYKAAIDHLWDDFTKARVSFNFALGLLKSGDYAAARDWFEKAVELSRGKLTRATYYLSKLNAFLARRNEDKTAIHPAPIAMDLGLQDNEEFESESLTPAVTNIASNENGEIEPVLDYDFSTSVSEVIQPLEVQISGLERYYFACQQQGQYMPAIKDRIYRLSLEYGNQQLGRGIEACLATNDLKLDSLANWLVNNAKKAG